MAKIKVPSWERLERLLAMNLLAIHGLQRTLSVEESAELLARAGLSVERAAEVIGTTSETIGQANFRKRRKG
jgi:hypothetical protein